MLTVTFLGNILAAFAGGAVMGWRFKSGQVAEPASQPQPQEAAT